ncbi:putative bifunctional diguanylate cyclase/phosphodiesterase [Cysteiniphilum sp. JM-1]|uniref:putative bifunctional diguanylate cyclase/phosphodiesterase n=1 Tax=Cysteiniphilum sp. JM-1 TaxID=2610891 RepID=UPI001246690C|nr:EAL domain-containing protein [Cysteiniphilum sp. JM-1]
MKIFEKLKKAKKAKKANRMSEARKVNKLIGKKIFWRVLISTIILLTLASLTVFVLSFYPFYQQTQRTINHYYEEVLDGYKTEIQLSLSEARSVALQISSRTQAAWLTEEIERKYQYGDAIIDEVNALRQILASALVSSAALQSIQRFESNGHLLVEVGTKQHQRFDKKALTFAIGNDGLTAVLTSPIYTQIGQDRKIIGYDRLYFDLSKLLNKFESESLTQKRDFYWFIKSGSSWQAISSGFANNLTTLPSEVLTQLKTQEHSNLLIQDKKYYFERINGQQVLALGVDKKTVASSVWRNLSHIPLTILGFVIIFILLIYLLLRPMLNKVMVENNQFYQLLNEDEHTALPSRRYFDTVFEKILIDESTNNKKVALLHIDIDHFKNINDSFGYYFGNIVLREIATRLKSSVRKSDFVARIGGDEFVVVLKDIRTLDDVKLVINHLFAVVHQSILVNDYPISLKASIGAAISPEHASDRETLMQYTDMAIRDCKKAGGNSYCIFNENIGARYFRQLELGKHLANAIKNNEFYLMFQPIIHLNDKQQMHFEVLLRWHNRYLGEVSPGEFIPVAEELKLIVELGAWVIRQAFYQLYQWHEDETIIHKPSISINLSAVQINNPSVLLAFLEHLMAQMTIPSEYVTFEVTETVIMENLDNTSQVLNTLKNMGFKISIDDFGTGFCSLSYLIHAQIDNIKIDKIFIDDMLTNINSKLIVESIIDLSHRLGSTVVAEGVETIEQYQLLKKVHCDYIQGYYFSVPLSAYDATHFIEHKPHHQLF